LLEAPGRNPHRSRTGARDGIELVGRAAGV